ncbi:MAG: purine-nucleoside phosphorylase [Deltaproteobacteria bacterium]|nr:MAG: purine-nucleoside phosphorylase [Deltaproteobacteria bacterium]
MLETIQEAVASIRSQTDFVPRVAGILGSGLGFLADEIDVEVAIPYEEIKHFPLPSVSGHHGKLVMGHVGSLPVAILSGRVHYYEGLTPHEVVLPIRVLRSLGADTAIITNASGGLRADFDPGDLMLITDHINLMGYNPLIGPNVEEWGPRFPDMTEAYSKKLRNLALAVAKEQGCELHQGVYLGTSGPSYETPAEIRMFAAMGGDAVGMSTVPEVIAARHMGMEVLAISCVANPAAGIAEGELSHEEVTAAVVSKKEIFGALVREILHRL